MVQQCVMALSNQLSTRCFLRVERAIAAFLMTLISQAALAAQFSDNFSGESLDTGDYRITEPGGFEIYLENGELILDKLEGTTSGFANVSTAFTVRGDFVATIEAQRTGATAAGLLSSHIARGFTDIYFGGNGALISNILVGPVQMTQSIAPPAAVLTLRIRREGDHVTHEYDSGTGFAVLGEATNAVLAGAVTIGVFIGEEGGSPAPSTATYDDLEIEGDVFTFCGNTVLDDGEECDDQDPEWATGQSCSASCELLPCGDPDDSGAITVVDALHVLRTSVGTSSCDDCVCNVDDSEGAPTVSDALRVLRVSVGQQVELTCPPCPGPTAGLGVPE
jgi:hypothetical protein